MQQLQAALDEVQASQAASQAAFEEVLQRKDEELVRLTQASQSLQETSSALQAGLTAAQQRCTTLEEDSGVSAYCPFRFASFQETSACSQQPCRLAWQSPSSGAPPWKGTAG